MGTKRNERPARAEARPIPRAYLRLLEKFMLRPIANEQDLAEATAVADDLFGRAALLPEEEQYLEVLCDLIETYEDEHHPILDVGAAAMLRFLIDQRGVTQHTVSRETGIANSTITALLQGSRDMTRKHIETFAKYFGVEPAVFLPGNGPAEAGAWVAAGTPSAVSRRRRCEA